MHHIKLFLASLLLEASAASLPYANPLLGLVFPPPTLSENGSFSRALASLKNSLTSAIIDAGFNDTSISVALFDTGSTLFNFQYTTPSVKLDALGTDEVDLNTIYRIGSASKLITAYLFIIEVGDRYWDESVTKFVPELQAATEKCSAQADEKDCVDWTGVTLGALSSHMAGVPRDYSLATNELFGSAYVSQGLPPLNASEVPPCASSYNDPCSRKQFLNGLAQRHPIFAPFSTPIYSNDAYQILTYALEGITNRTFEAMFQKDLVEQLGLTGTSYTAPSTVSRAVIPVNDSASGWSYIIGDETPAGGLFSTPSDLLKIGQSMLNHSFLSPLATRKWMKPVAHTADLRWSVGMPWEILRATPGNGTRIVDLYTKAGDLGYYGAVLAIVPDYNAGFVINVAGPNYAALLAAASDIVADIYLPALEQAAKQQALTNFAGTYKSSMMNSTLVLEVDQAKPGVGLTKFISNGTDLLPLLAALYANDGDTLDIRLYPSNLRTPAGNGQTKVPFLALFADADYSTSTGIFASTFSDGTWQVIDEWHYGNVGLDEFLFTLDEGGRAVSVSPRVLRTILGRVA